MANAYLATGSAPRHPDEEGLLPLGRAEWADPHRARPVDRPTVVLLARPPNHVHRHRQTIFVGQVIVTIVVALDKERGRLSSSSSTEERHTKSKKHSTTAESNDLAGSEKLFFSGLLDAGYLLVTTRCRSVCLFGGERWREKFGSTSPSVSLSVSLDCTVLVSTYVRTLELLALHLLS